MKIREIIHEGFLFIFRNKRNLFSIVIITAGLLFIWLYHFFHFWNHLQTDTFNHLVEYRGNSVKGFRGRQILVHKRFLPHLKRIDSYAKKSRVKIKVVQSYRYEKKKIRKTVVEPAKWSNHLAGYAIDMNISYKNRGYSSKNLSKSNCKNWPVALRDFIGAVRRDGDLRWGGDFSTPDPVHIDCPLNRDSIQLWKQYKDSCWQDYRNAAPVWQFWK